MCWRFNFSWTFHIRRVTTYLDVSLLLICFLYLCYWFIIDIIECGWPWTFGPFPFVGVKDSIRNFRENARRIWIDSFHRSVSSNSDIFAFDTLFCMIDDIPMSCHNFYSFQRYRSAKRHWNGKSLCRKFFFFAQRKRDIIHDVHIFSLLRSFWFQWRHSLFLCWKKNSYELIKPPWLCT